MRLPIWFPFLVPAVQDICRKKYKIITSIQRSLHYEITHAASRKNQIQINAPRERMQEAWVEQQPPHLPLPQNLPVKGAAVDGMDTDPHTLQEAHPTHRRLVKGKETRARYSRASHALGEGGQRKSREEVVRRREAGSFFRLNEVALTLLGPRKRVFDVRGQGVLVAPPALGVHARVELAKGGSAGRSARGGTRWGRHGGWWGSRMRRWRGSRRDSEPRHAPMEEARVRRTWTSRRHAHTHGTRALSRRSFARPPHSDRGAPESVLPPRRRSHSEEGREGHATVRRRKTVSRTALTWSLRGELALEGEGPGMKGRREREDGGQAELRKQEQ
ncbi:hypothetical protein C8R44DRAFT_723492 [Mycena epipterygia]|nr:hypothetical protein C8R44DRAFT_723492 [Mycena epipterygia]